MESYISSGYGTSPHPCPISGNAIVPTAQVDTGSREKKIIPLGFTCARPIKANPLPLILFILFASPYIRPVKAGFVEMDNTNDYTGELDEVLDMLSSIHPYLDPQFQDGANFIFGMNEIKNKLNNLIGGKYHPQSVSKSLKPVLSQQERAIGIVKSLQPYISLENQTLINRILDINMTLEKLLDRTRRFSQYEGMGSQSPVGANIARIMQIIDIVEVLLPAEQLNYIERVKGVLKVVEAAELAQMLMPQGNKAFSVGTSADSSPDPKDKPLGDNPDYSASSGKTVEGDSMIEGLKAKLNPQQAKSLEMIMNMAQLLSKDLPKSNNAE